MSGLLSGLFGKSAQPFPLDEASWVGHLALPVFSGLDGDERARLKDLAGRLLADKRFSGAGDQQVDAAMATAIAAFAALPILNLGYGGYTGWREIIVYPGEFMPERQVTDEAGIVHHIRRPMSGESWAGGPLILSWQDVIWSGQAEGFNVVIHEFAHKLDMRSGRANGQPPLHSGMRAEDWSDAFSSAYADFCRRADAGEETAVDPYAAESPAEFFAVLSEYFFEAPDLLIEDYPRVYEQMRLYYRQDTYSRMGFTT